MLNNLEKFYNNFFSFLIFSFPFFLVTGPLLSEIAMFLLISFFIFEILKYKKISFLFKTKLTKLIIFFQLIILISIINSDLNNFKLYKNFFYFRYFLFTLSIFYFLCKKFYADRSVLKDLVRIAKCDEKELIDLLLKYSNPKYDSQNEKSINIFLMQKSWSRAL